jgi:hypothetical protein
MKGQDWTKRVAGTLLVLWSGWWIFFAVASAATGGRTADATLRDAVLPFALVFVLVLLVPALGWCLRRAGAILLIGEGCVLLVTVLGVLHNGPTATAFLLATLALPPLLAGVLLYTRPKPSGGIQPAG